MRKRKHKAESQKKKNKFHHPRNWIYYRCCDYVGRMEGRNLWITIGPQCCGKTTFLRDRNVTDVSMDAMPETYYPYLVDEVIKYSQGDLSEDDWHKYERDIYGLTISSRIDQLGESECLALILFFHEVLSY